MFIYSKVLYFAGAFDMLQDAVYDSVFLPALPANHRADNTSIDWDRNARFLPSCSNIAHAKVPGWNSQQVADFVKSIKPQLSEDHLQKFIAEVSAYFLFLYLPIRRCVTVSFLLSTN